MPDNATFKGFQNLLSSRHSCRAFLPDQLSEAQIHSIVDAAQCVPSWCNAQPWQLTITRGAATDNFRDFLLNVAKTETSNTDIPMPKQYTGVYKERRSTCGWALYDAVGIEKGDRAASGQQMLENFTLFGAPHVAIVTTERDLGAYGVLDCGGFVTGFCLAATALGIATIPQAAVANFCSQLHEYFDIPETRNIVCAISFGLEDTTHPANGFRTDRAAPEQVIDWR